MVPQPVSSVQKLRVVFDMTFPDRNHGGSGVYARSLLATLRERDDLELAEIRSSRPGPMRTVRWLASKADSEIRAADAHLLHSPSFVVPWKVPVPFVVTVFDLSTRRFPRDHPFEWRAYERWFLPSRVRAAARVITISDLTRQDVIREYGVAPHRVVTIYPGVNQRFFGIEGRAGRAPGAEPLLLFPGAPVARKNLELVLQAMAQATPASAVARACLQISGAAEEQFPDQVERVRALHLADRVRWLGQVSAEDMPAVMASADVCLYPSLYEGFGFPPLEAMASGTPVVASNASCLPEILNGAALLVDPSDVRVFAQAVESVLSDPQVRGRLVDSGRKRAAGFTWQRCAEQTVEVYRAAMAAA